MKNLIVFDERKGVIVIYCLSKISFQMDQIRQYMFDMPCSFTNKILSFLTPLQYWRIRIKKIALKEVLYPYKELKFHQINSGIYSFKYDHTFNIFWYGYYIIYKKTTKLFFRARGRFYTFYKSCFSSEVKIMISLQFQAC